MKTDIDTAVEDAVRHIRANLEGLFAGGQPGGTGSGSVPLSRLLTDTLAADPDRFTPAVAVRAVQKLIDDGVLDVDFVQPRPGPGPHRLDDPAIQTLLALPTSTGESVPSAVAEMIGALPHRVRLTHVRRPRPADEVSPAAVAGAVQEIRAGLAARFADALSAGMSEAAQAEVVRVPLIDVLTDMPGDRPPRYGPAVYVAAADRMIADGDLVYEVVGATAVSAPVRLSVDSLILHMLTSGLPVNVVLKDGDRYLKATHKFIGELEDEGKVVRQTLVVEVAGLSPEQKATADGMSAVKGFEPTDDGPTPKWAGRVLTYEEWSCDYRKRKRAPSQEALLDALEAAQWETPLDVRSLLRGEEAIELHSAVRHLNARLNLDGSAPIVFDENGKGKAEWRPAESTAASPATPRGSPRKSAAKGPAKTTAKRKSK